MKTALILLSPACSERHKEACNVSQSATLCSLSARVTSQQQMDWSLTLQCLQTLNLQRVAEPQRSLVSEHTH